MTFEELLVLIDKMNEEVGNATGGNVDSLVHSGLDVHLNKKQNSTSQSWLYVILILLLLFGAVTLISTLETNNVKREQIRIYNRINNTEQSLRTKDKELEQYLIKEAQK